MEQVRNVFIRLISEFKREGARRAERDLRSAREELRRMRAELRRQASAERYRQQMVSGTLTRLGQLRHEISNLSWLEAKLTSQIREQELQWRRWGTALGRAAVQVGILRAVGAGLSRLLGFRITPVTWRMGRALLNLGRRAMAAINPLNALRDTARAVWRTFRVVTVRYVLYRVLDQVLEFVTGMTRALMQTAPAFEEIQRSFHALASAAGVAGRKLLEAMREAAAGTLSHLDLMQKANYAVLVYGKNIVQYLPELIAGARRASKILGVNMAYAYESLINGLARTSKKILDNIGIVFNANAAYRAFAARLGKTAAELTEAERKAAFLEATLAFLRMQARAVGEVSITAKDALAMLRAQFKDLAAIGFQVFMPVLKGIALGLGRLVEAAGPKLRFGLAVSAALLEHFTRIVRRLAQVISRSTPFRIIARTLRGIGETLGWFVAEVDRNMPRILAYLDTLGLRLLEGSKKWTWLSDAAATGLSTLRLVLSAALKAMQGDWEDFWLNLGEAAKLGLTYSLMVLGDWATRVYQKFDEWSGGFLSWGFNLIANFARGFVEGASSVLVSALGFVGNLIKMWIGASSPPRVGPLRKIIEWGRRLIEQYFYGFTLASFDFMEQALRPVEERLRTLFDIGYLDETRYAEVMLRAQELVARLGKELQEQGKLSEETLTELGELMEGAGEDVLDYVRALARLSAAQARMTEVQEEYNKEAEKGFVTEEMATKMRKARLELRAAEEEAQQQRALSTQIQRGFDIWARQEAILESLERRARQVGEAMEDLLSGMDLGLAKLGETGKSVLDAFKERFEKLKPPMVEFSERFKQLRRDIELFMRGFRGEPWLGREPMPEAFRRGMMLRQTLDELRTRMEKLREEAEPLVEKIKEFFDQFSEEDIQRLGRAAGKFVALLEVITPLQKVIMPVVKGFINLGTAFLILKAILAGVGIGGALGLLFWLGKLILVLGLVGLAIWGVWEIWKRREAIANRFKQFAKDAKSRWEELHLILETDDPWLRAVLVIDMLVDALRNLKNALKSVLQVFKEIRDWIASHPEIMLIPGLGAVPIPHPPPPPPEPEVPEEPEAPEAPYMPPIWKDIVEPKPAEPDYIVPRHLPMRFRI